MRAAAATGYCTLGAWAALLLGSPVVAQTPQLPKMPGWVLKANVFQPLARGYHLEAEKLWRAHPRTSLGLTAQWYRGAVTGLTVRREVQPGERVRGVGAELLPRLYFPGPDAQLQSGFYLAAGPHVQHFRLHFQEYGWVEQARPDELPILVYSPLPYVETITRYGASVLAGYQGPLELGPLMLDFYAGIGWRQSRFHSALPGSRYRTSILDYGAQGVYFPVGFKLGIRL
ncbi:hypothetical protein [Hymenobacter jeollabukensis]|uniref:DUF3575 domain-containing protein n=1 Tax=Hymenobacter jeollabukensis TaxID=2025313 RepID=A0A5R8WR72_9BACT|nr:hypothetical protein [Hymenobacter jeollabukensis]TLM93030.1 hypothetical protein FDY95_10355 [Hymenobacter jeollabukensis]